MYLDKKSQSLEEFYEKARKITDQYNHWLQNELELLFGTNLDWLQFTLLSYLDYYRERKYRVKLNVNWRKFLNFINNYSKNEQIELWKKYRYITSCKHALYLILTESKGKIRENLSKVQEDIRKLTRYDLAEIDRAVGNVIEYIKAISEKIHNRILIIRKAVIGRGRDRFILSFTLLYTPELTSTLGALKDLANRGIFPACYREMRKIVENLAWVMFDDVLYFRSLIVNKYWLFRPYSDIPKEWHNLKSKFAGIYEIKQAESRVKDILRGIKSLKHEKSLKEEIVKTILKDMAYPSFIAFFSRDASNIEQDLKEILPVLSSASIMDIVEADLKRVLAPLNLSNDSINEILRKLRDTLPSEIIIAFPSNKFVLEFTDNMFSTSLYRSYSEYSFFVHSYFTSWHVMPFSSILEVKIFKHELNMFLSEIQKLFKNYLNLLSQIAKSIRS